MIRHWNAWDEGKRSHLFVADAQTGEAKDLTPSSRSTPPLPRSAARPTTPGRPTARSSPSPPSRARTPPGRPTPTSGRFPSKAASPRTSPRATRRRRSAGLFARRRMARLCQPGPGGVRVGPVGVQGPLSRHRSSSSSLTEVARSPRALVLSGTSKRHHCRRSIDDWGPSRSSRSTFDESVEAIGGRPSTATAGSRGWSPAAFRRPQRRTQVGNNGLRPSHGPGPGRGVCRRARRLGPRPSSPTTTPP